jgi:signal transduction histidine kinase
MVRPVAESKALRMDTFLDPAAGAVRADPERLQQIVANLLSNAVKFTGPGGKVSILLDRVEAQVHLQVADTGKGIRPDFLPHVFERFRQADPTTARREGGLGLGLAIVRRLVELHGGTITAESPGERLGSTFTVYLPAA